MARWKDTGHRMKREAKTPGIPPSCRQGKRGFQTRTDAKRYMKIRCLVDCREYACPEQPIDDCPFDGDHQPHTVHLHGGVSRFCPGQCSLFHVGHLPADVTSGAFARAELRPVRTDRRNR